MDPLKKENDESQPLSLSMIANARTCLEQIWHIGLTGSYLDYILYYDSYNLICNIPLWKNHYQRQGLMRACVLKVKGIRNPDDYFTQGWLVDKCPSIPRTHLAITTYAIFSSSIKNKPEK